MTILVTNGKIILLCQNLKQTSQKGNILTVKLWFLMKQDKAKHECSVACRPTDTKPWKLKLFKNSAYYIYRNKIWSTLNFTFITFVCCSDSMSKYSFLTCNNTIFHQKASPSCTFIITQGYWLKSPLLLCYPF